MSPAEDGGAVEGLVRNLWGGCVTREKRWPGDTFSDLGSGCIDESATDQIMARAADQIISDAAEITRLRAEVEQLSKPEWGTTPTIADVAAANYRAKDLQRKLDAALAEVERKDAALEPFARHLNEMKFDLDYEGNELPDDQAVGWVYVTNGDFRRARAALSPAE
ncbi:MAG: hypothetical protein P0Y66_22420 [Candidatus Kaistia colombiensis]|nr:MAG: hypothetical protein P0Y66_22420 [Kaistia sp.]